MIRRLEQGIEEIAYRPGKEYAHPSQTASDLVGQEKSEKRTENQISDEVGEIGVQTQGGNRPPPLSPTYKPGMSLTCVPPV